MHIFILPLLILLQSAYALEITNKALESYVQMEADESFGYFGNVSAVGEIGLKNINKIRGGFSYGWFEESPELKSFVSANTAPFTKIPIDFSLLWNYNGIFEYDVHSHNIIPFATYNWKRTGLSFGYNFRFTSFLGEDYIREDTPAWKFYWNIVNNETLLLTFIWGNFNEFNARNLVGYSYNFIANIRVNDRFEVINGIDLLQSGAVSFVESLYAVSFKMGVRYLW